MNKFGELLYTLRKQKGMTQQELAHKLNVTNKAVSKWETGDSFPETSLLVPLSQILEVSVDELLKGELITDREELIKLNQNSPVLNPIAGKDAFIISLGIALIIIGVILLIVLSELGFSVAIYMSCFFVCIAFAVFIFSFFEMLRAIKKVEMEKENQKRGIHFALMISIGICFFILSPLNLIAFSALDIDKIFYMPLFFIFIIIGLILVITGDAYWNNYKMQYNLPNKEHINNDKYKRISGAISGCIMMVATAIFLILGLVYMKWHPGWIVFPISGLLCAIVSIIFDALSKK